MVVSNSVLSCLEPLSKLLDRKWALLSAASPIHQIMVSYACKEGMYGDISFASNSQPHLGDKLTEDGKSPLFYILRDDLLHPLINGNKARKLDALMPILEEHLVTDLVTCGGCQSAHAAAVAVSCAERGVKSHLLLRGEQPEILTGYNLISMLYGNVSYIPRSVYAKREEILKIHAGLVSGANGCVIWCDDILEATFTSENSERDSVAEGPKSLKHKNFPRKVVVVNEGAGDVAALLGMFRLVKYLSQDHIFGRKRRMKLVVDAGTGTTAIGLGLAATLLELPWEILAVMLADTNENYILHEKRLISKFKGIFNPLLVNHKLNEEVNPVQWIQRDKPRKFGNVLEGDIELCQEIARSTGVLLDPIYTLAAWETATRLSLDRENEDSRVVMLHTGGTLGMFGLAQRYSKSYFSELNR